MPHRDRGMGIATLVVVALTAAGAAPAAAQGAGASADDALTAQIRVLERALSRAVASSARGVEQQMPPWAPGLMPFAGPVQVRGFRLAGYGVFFDVECPVLRQSILWSLEMMDADLRMMRRALERPGETGGGGGTPRGFAADAGTTVSFAPGGASAPDDRRQRAAAGDAPAAGPAPPAAPAPDLRAVYREALRGMLIEALLRHGGRLGALLDRGDWLTAVARDARGLPGRDTTVRIRAGDAAALHAGALSLDEARARVDASSF